MTKVFNIIKAAFGKCFSDKYNLVLGIIWGIINSFVAVFGHTVYKTNSIEPLISSTGAVVRTIAIFIGLTVVFAFFGILIFKILSTLQFVKQSEKQTKWYLYVIIFLVSWICFYLCFRHAFEAYYPGIDSYDFFTQAYYYFDLFKLSKHHPMLHTLFIFWSIDYGTEHHILAQTVYAMVQIPIFSFILAGCITYLYRLRIKWQWIILCGLFFIINPTIAIFSVITTKDVLFGADFAFVTLLLVGLCKQTDEMLKNHVFRIAYIISVLFACLYRNNAVYAFILAEIVTVIILRKYWKRLLVLLSIPIICFFIIDKILFSAIMQIPETESAEKLCVPMQQISKVYCEHKDELTEKELEFINEYIDVTKIEDTYNPRFADPIKLLFDSEKYDYNKISFWKEWATLGVKYPASYISGFLTLNIPLWYWGADTLDEYSNRDYIEINWMSRDRSKSHNQKALDFYERFSTYEFIQKHPVVEVLFSIVTPIWLMLVSIFTLLFRKKKHMLPVLVPALVMWLTIIVGPVSNYRYMFPFVLIYPFIFIFTFEKESKKEEENAAK